MRLIDSHAHIDFENFDKDREQLLKKLFSTKIYAFMNLGVDLQTSLNSVRLSEKHKYIACGVGVHPNDADTWNESVKSELISLVKKSKKIRAWGEIGLDYYRDHTSPELQKKVFIEQLNIAEKLNKPVVIHDRDAHGDIMDILKDFPQLKIILHLFSGNEDMAEEAVKRDYFLSFGGQVTFKRNNALPITKHVPLEQLLVETDSPFISPVPLRGKRNNPGNVYYTAKTISDFLGIEFPEFVNQVNRNTFNAFDLNEIFPQCFAYKVKNGIYFNLTNRCQNNCYFCIRNFTDELNGFDLRLAYEPTPNEVVLQAEKLLKQHTNEIDEFVFCGFGEPTIRLDLIKETAAELKRHGIPFRLNTNGLGNKYHNRNIISELKDFIHTYAVSLNASNRETYQKICRSSYGPSAYEEIKDFIRKAEKFGRVKISYLENLPEIDSDKIESTTEEFDNVSVKKRHFNR